MGKWWTLRGGKRVRTAAGVRHEHEAFQSSRRAKDDNAARKRARYQLEKEGRVHKGDNKEVDHRDSNPRHNSHLNLRVVDKSTNRGKKENSRLPGSKRKGRKK